MNTWTGVCANKAQRTCLGATNTSWRSTVNPGGHGGSNRSRASIRSATSSWFKRRDSLPSTVIVSRFAEEDSIVGCIELARIVADRGSDIALVFTHEALHALHRGTMRWSQSLVDRRSRARIIEKAVGRGLQFADASRDARWSDIRTLVEQIGSLPRIRLVACPVWSDYLDLGDALPHLERVTAEEYADLLLSSTVIGGY